MEIVIELPRDIDKLCRTCMNIVEDEKNCVITKDNKKDTELNTMLHFLTDTTASSSNECLPRFMCNDCVEKLHISYMFKEQCQNTFANFKNFMSSNKDLNNTDKPDFVCSVCALSFSTRYKLSKHQIKHYQQQRLFSIFKDDTKAKVDLVNNEDEEEIILLIAERKQEENKTNKENKSNGKIFEEILVESGLDLVDDEDKRRCDLCNREFVNLLSLQLHFINHAILAESDTDPEIFNQYFQCYTCGETFSTSEDMDSHTLSCVSGIKEFKCRTCKDVFKSDLLLLKHQNEVLLDCNSTIWQFDKDKFVCAICNEDFPVKTELYLHSVRHIIKKITCRICKKSFSCELALNNHIRTHPKYKHMCNLCGKWLGSRHALKTHVMGVHSVSKNYVCGVCSKAFKTPSRLYIHKLTHKEEKKFVCTICDYKTNYVGDFRVHNRIHTAERPYKCNFVNCKRQFKTSSHLNEHIQRHLQIKKYRCNLCYMVFGHNHTLKMHLMVHTGEKPFTCQICKVKFRRKHHLKNHMKQHGNIETENV